nr:dynamin family protein [Actinomycetospora corticicola]
MRVALAGSIKTGKSTLLNALVGEQIAPTGVGECTRVTTHYADGPSPRIGVTYRGARRDADPVELPALHRRGSLVIETERLDLARVAALHVDWPTQHLRDVTLIDTPGVDSAVTRSVWGEFSEDVVDCVVHLVRHLHEPDVAFLESYGDRVAENVGAAGTFVVLSRADEVGGGRVDAVMAAQQVARRYRTDPVLRPWCATTTTVAGLVAETARTLRGVEFTALRTLSRLDRAELDAQLLTADRFVQASGVLPSGTRLALLDRFGLFGVRLATSLLRRGVDDSAALAAELARRSGLDELRDILERRFLARRDVFQARSALLAVDRFLARARDAYLPTEQSSTPIGGAAGPRPSPVPRTVAPAALAALAEHVDRVRAGAHGIVELDVLTRLRRRPLDVPGRAGAALTEEAERLLGGEGPSAPARLGVAEDTAAGELRAVALAALGRWRGHAENPFADADAVETAQAVVRSLEGVLVELPRPVAVGVAGS